MLKMWHNTFGDTVDYTVQLEMNLHTKRYTFLITLTFFQGASS